MAESADKIGLLSKSYQKLLLKYKAEQSKNNVPKNKIRKLKSTDIAQELDVVKGKYERLRLIAYRIA